MRLEIAFLSALCVMILACKTEQKEIEQHKKKPNVLIVFPDQLRRYSAGYWSKDPYRKLVVGEPDPVYTPSIDKIAENGIVFSQAISNFPLCSPYRGMMMSGVYPEQNGIWNNCKKGRDESLRNDIPTIPSLFLHEGYNTAYIGKCHWLKNEPVFDQHGNFKGTTDPPGGHRVNNYDTYVPPGKTRHGIEYFYQALKDEHYNPHIYSNDSYVIDGKKDGELHLPKVFSPKNEATIIIDYLKNNRGQRDTDKPFCMIWSMNPPHNPWDDANTDMETLSTYYNTDKFPAIDETMLVRENVALESGQHARNYYANVTSSDFYIGLVLDQLKAMGELDNTIVVFSSDHGEMLGSHGKQGKNVLELESVAIPLIVHWPNGLKPGTSNVLFSVPDVLPTIMGLAGISDKIPNTIEGTDFSSILFDDKNENIQKPSAVLLMLQSSRGVLTDRYTLCISEDGTENDHKLGEAFIYDTLQDPYQLHKIQLKDRPKVSDELLTELAFLLKKTNDPWYQEKKYSNLIPYF